MRWLLVGLTLVSLGAAPTPPLRLLVRPQIGSAPQDLYVEVRLVPDRTDRILAVSTAGPDFVRSSAWTIDGERAPRLYSFWWIAVPAGDYEIHARVGHEATVRAQAIQQVTIIGF